MKKKLLIIIPAILVAIVAAIFIFAKLNSISPLSWGSHDPVYSSSGVAIKGYAPVAYFEEGKAKQGNSDLSHEWNGAEWHFYSNANLEKFKTSPEKYAPQYGGYCAFAVSQGFTATVDPNFWTIDNEKLYIFSNQDVLDDWNEQKELEKAATDNWK